ETKPPAAPKSGTPGRQPEPAVEASRKKDTGGRSAAPAPAAGAKAAGAAPPAPAPAQGARPPAAPRPASFRRAMPAAADWRGALWPASQQGRMLRLATARAVAGVAGAAVGGGLPAVS